MTKRNVIAFVVILASAVVLLNAAWRHARERTERSVCSSLLWGLGKSLNEYALHNNGLWGVVPSHKRPSTTQPGGEVTYVRRIGARRGCQSQPAVGATGDDTTQVSTTRSIWLMYSNYHLSPKCLFCPEAGASSWDEPEGYWDFGTGDQAGDGIGSQDPAVNWKQVSHGYQVPFGRLGQPRADCDKNMALAADKGPYGAWLEAGLGSDPGVPTASASDRAGKWRRWNSPNHGGVGQGAGQNVLYPDGRVEWHSTPLAGVNKDNIYTQWPSFTPDEKGRVRGRPPTLNGREVPMGETDTLLYP